MLSLEIDIRGFRKLVKGQENISKGYQAKFTDGNKWVKLDKEGRNESIAEEFTSELLKLSNLDPVEYVNYKRCDVYDGKTYLGKGCLSDNFTNKGESIITFQRLFNVAGFDSSEMYEAVNENDSLIYEVKKVIRNISGLDITEYLKKIITVDSIILNPDRHFNNLALVFNSITGEYRFAPIFDNGMGFLMGEHLYKDKPLEYQTDRTFSKPFYHNFVTQYKFLKCPGMTFNKNKVIDLMNKYDNEKITHVMGLAFKKYPEAFRDLSRIKSF